MTTILQIIKDTINALDPTLDLSASSPETDLLITPGSLMMEPFIRQLQFLLGNLGLTDPTAIDPAELDAILGNFLQFRNQGTPSTGVVELFYTTPTNLDIPTGTTFIDNLGNTYTNNIAYYISSDTMSVNAWLYPYYSTGPIAVSSTTTGITTSIGPNQIVSTSLTPAPAVVTNPAGFTPGTNTETNADFVMRALTSVINGSLGSAAGIQNTLYSDFPTIQNISVRGMGDQEMLRDVVLSGINEYPYQTIIDFYGKVSGLDDLPYPESLAYWTVFWDDPATSGIQPDLPTLADALVTQFTTDQYSGLYKLSDASYTTLNTSTVLEEHFTNATSVPSYWRLSDAQLGLAMVKSTDEFSIAQVGGGNKIQLGNSLASEEVPTRPIQVDTQFMFNILNSLKLVTGLPSSASAAQPIIQTYQDFINYYG